LITATAESDVLEFLLENLVDPPELNDDQDGDGHQQKSREPKPKDLEPIPIDTFEELIAIYEQEGMFMPQTVKDTLAVTLATILTPMMGGNEMVLLFIRGPSSSGKSTICEAVSANSRFSVPVSKFTGFHSGVRKKGKKDLSLMKVIDGKTMFVKDWTVILSLPDASRNQIEGELRDVTDGSSEARFKNGVYHSYKNFRMAMVAGVTDAILKYNDSELGSRFLHIDITDEFHGSKSHIKAALTSTVGAILGSFQQRGPEGGEEKERFIPKDKMERIKRCTAGFINVMYDRFVTQEPPEVPDWFTDKVTAIGMFVSKIKAEVTRKGYERDIIYRPRSAIGIRIGNQLMKVGVGLSVVLGTNRLGGNILRILRKMSLDTAQGFNYDIVAEICKAHDNGSIGLDKAQIAKRVNLTESNVKKRLDDLRVMGLISLCKSANGEGKGRNRHVYQFKHEYRELWRSFNGKKLVTHHKKKD